LALYTRTNFRMSTRTALGDRGLQTLPWPLFLALLLALPATAGAAGTLEVELSAVFPGYNEVAVPGKGGTRFSLTDGFSVEQSAAYRVRYGQWFSTRHWFGLLAAPLTTRSKGTLAEDTAFNGELFPAGSRVNTAFVFNSYRLLYRYQLYQIDRVDFDFGAALKVRDASITLRGDNQTATKSNTGIVPLLSFFFSWQAHDKLQLLIDGEALAAPQGRAEDVLFAAQYRLNRSLALRAGYRILEGGADNDEVYTFSLFHQAVLGASWTF